MCVDFTGLNKACPKDNYPLPSIDELVEGDFGNQILSMMDAHFSYSQILMHKRDEGKQHSSSTQAPTIKESCHSGSKTLVLKVPTLGRPGLLTSTQA